MDIGLVGCSAGVDLCRAWLSFQASGGEVLSAEKQLVQGICNGGGVRVQPRPEDLQKFVKSASSLDGEQLARQLLAQVVANPHHFPRTLINKQLLQQWSRGFFRAPW
jgi:hypothetical protein